MRVKVAGELLVVRLNLVPSPSRQKTDRNKSVSSDTDHSSTHLFLPDSILVTFLRRRFASMLTCDAGDQPFPVGP